MAPKKDSPSLDNRPGPKPAPDYGTDAAEVGKSSPQTPTPAASTPAPAPTTATPAPAPRQQVYVVQLNTRVAHPYKEMLQDLSARQGTTIRHLIEHALDQAYGKPEGL